MIPQWEQETDVGEAESTDEVFFESLDSSFHVDAMIVRFDELNCTIAA